MRISARLTLAILAACVASAALTGCSDKEPAAPEKPKAEAAKTETAKIEPAKTEPAKTEPAETETPKTETPKIALPGVDALKTGGLTVLLAKADEFDGTVDKVVSKCSSCSFTMNGNAEHAVSAHGYTLQFCSDDCKTGFEKDVDKSILALTVPAKP